MTRNTFPQGVTRVTLTVKPGAPVAVANGQGTTLPDGRVRATYTRLELCHAVATTGGCPDCYRLGGRRCEWRTPTAAVKA